MNLTQRERTLIEQCLHTRVIESGRALRLLEEANADLAAAAARQDLQEATALLDKIAGHDIRLECQHEWRTLDSVQGGYGGASYSVRRCVRCGEVR